MAAKSCGSGWRRVCSRATCVPSPTCATKRQGAALHGRSEETLLLRSVCAWRSSLPSGGTNRPQDPRAQHRGLLVAFIRQQLLATVSMHRDSCWHFAPRRRCRRASGKDRRSGWQISGSERDCPAADTSFRARLKRYVAGAGPDESSPRWHDACRSRRAHRHLWPDQCPRPISPFAAFNSCHGSRSPWRPAYPWPRPPTGTGQWPHGTPRTRAIAR